MNAKDVNNIMAHFNPKPESLEDVGVCPRCGGNILRREKVFVENNWELYIKEDLDYGLYECLGCRCEFRVVPDHLWNGEPKGIKFEIVNQ